MAAFVPDDEPMVLVLSSLFFCISIFHLNQLSNPTISLVKVLFISTWCTDLQSDDIWRKNVHDDADAADSVQVADPQTIVGSSLNLIGHLGEVVDLKQIELCLIILMLAVVVAQVVERWHSVQPSRVRMPGRTWLFWEMLSIYSRWVSGYL